MPKYKTTRAVIPLNAVRETIEQAVNDHITIQLRRYELSDVHHIYRLRTQPNVMVNTSTGVIDKDLNASQIWMDRKLPPNDSTTFDLVIWAKEGDQPWEHIGVLGCHKMLPVPHVGYMIREEWWGKSIMTTALRTFLRIWWALERKPVVVDTDTAEDEHDSHLFRLEMNQSDLDEHHESIDEEGYRVVPEILLAEIEENNYGSLRVIEKCGFKYRDRESVIENVGTFILCDYTLSAPTSRVE